MSLTNKKLFCVGLTGGIGSGKSTVADLFSKLKVPIIDADIIAHHITQPGEVAYQSIVDHFGKKIVGDNNALNRKKLRDIIFNNTNEKIWLENTIHPFIREKMREKIEKINAPYCICVIPLLAESTGIDFIDSVLVVTASHDNQLKRAKNRDNATQEDIQKIIKAQTNDAARLKIANDILTNDGDLASLTENVYKMHQHYLEMAKSQA